ncbi:MAG TPA: c-type cytochrome domain-containing protein, partial [Bryobacteraceae bacterium]|nr:c-type cytochrome domain-containing protein [Bryobacteraceae bacterium]
MRIALTICLMLSAQQAAGQTPSFAKDIVPIFEANCAGCHAGNVKMGSLDLDTFEGLMKGGNNGVVVVPGKSAESRLYLMVMGKATPAMPLSGKKLAAGEIELIRKWIDGGAKPPAPGEVVAKKGPAIPDIRPKVAVKAEIGSLAWRPDGKLLALGTYREVRLVDPQSKQVVATLGGHAQEVRAVAFSPDGKLLAAAGGLPARN